MGFFSHSDPQRHKKCLPLMPFPCRIVSLGMSRNVHQIVVALYCLLISCKNAQLLIFFCLCFFLTFHLCLTLLMWKGGGAVRSECVWPKRLSYSTLFLAALYACHIFVLILARVSAEIFRHKSCTPHAPMRWLEGRVGWVPPVSVCSVEFILIDLSNISNCVFFFCAKMQSNFLSFVCVCVEMRGFFSSVLSVLLGSSRL